MYPFFNFRIYSEAIIDVFCFDINFNVGFLADCSRKVFQTVHDYNFG